MVYYGIFMVYLWYKYSIVHDTDNIVYSLTWLVPGLEFGCSKKGERSCIHQGYMGMI